MMMVVPSMMVVTPRVMVMLDLLNQTTFIVEPAQATVAPRRNLPRHTEAQHYTEN